MFDDMMRFYTVYRVLGSKIQARVLNPGVTQSNQNYLTILKSPDGKMYQSFADSSHLLESNVRGNVKLIGDVNSTVLKGAYATACTQTYSQRKYFPGVQDINFEGQSNTNPSNGAFYEVVVFPVSNNNPGPIDLRISIQFVAMFSQPLLLAQSGVVAGPTGGIGVDGGDLFAGIHGVGATGLFGAFGSLGATGDAGGEGIGGIIL